MAVWALLATDGLCLVAGEDNALPETKPGRPTPPTGADDCRSRPTPDKSIPPRGAELALSNGELYVEGESDDKLNEDEKPRPNAGLPDGRDE